MNDKLRAAIRSIISNWIGLYGDHILIGDQEDLIGKIAGRISRDFCLHKHDYWDRIEEVYSDKCQELRSRKGGVMEDLFMQINTGLIEVSGRGDSVKENRERRQKGVVALDKLRGEFKQLQADKQFWIDETNKQAKRIQDLEADKQRLESRNAELMLALGEPANLTALGSGGKMSDTLRSYLASEVVKEEVFERHEPDCKSQIRDQWVRGCNCQTKPYERIVIERPVGLVAEAKERE